LETQDKLRQDYVRTQDPRDKDELLRIADAYDAGYKAGLDKAEAFRQVATNYLLTKLSAEIAKQAEEACHSG
jgi:hypothetical protein